MTESRNTGSDVPGFRRAGVVKERCRPRRSGQTRDTNPVGSEACFIELESDGIGRRTQWLVIRSKPHICQNRANVGHGICGPPAVVGLVEESKDPHKQRRCVRHPAEDQCAASKTIFCARQFKSSATYNSFSDGQAIS